MAGPGFFPFRSRSSGRKDKKPGHPEHAGTKERRSRPSSVSDSKHALPVPTALPPPPPEAEPEPQRLPRREGSLERPGSGRGSGVGSVRDRRRPEGGSSLPLGNGAEWVTRPKAPPPLDAFPRIDELHADSRPAVAIPSGLYGHYGPRSPLGSASSPTPMSLCSAVSPSSMGVPEDVAMEGVEEAPAFACNPQRLQARSSSCAPRHCQLPLLRTNSHPVADMPGEEPCTVASGYADAGLIEIEPFFCGSLDTPSSGRSSIGSAGSSTLGSGALPAHHHIVAASASATAAGVPTAHQSQPESPSSCSSNGRRLTLPRGSSAGMALLGPKSPLLCQWSGQGGVSGGQPQQGAAAPLPEVPVDASAPTLQVFSMRDLRDATKNFSKTNLLGEGGFGKVYRGQMRARLLYGLAEEDAGGRGRSSRDKSAVVDVAVKLLNEESMQGQKEWLTELQFLGELRHEHLVCLLGYASERKRLLLVYEYMANGSVEELLFQRPREFSWNDRLRIAYEAAKGLAYLHDEARAKKVIYRDFKTSNILLDRDFKAKLSDFGLARSAPTDGRTHVTTRVVGTHGYADPAYVMTGKLHVKSDVYSFGVVLLELMSGRLCVNVDAPPDERVLVEWALPFLTDRRTLYRLIDPALEDRYPVKCAQKCAKLVLSCLKLTVAERPSMATLVKKFPEILELCEPPVQP